MKTINDLFNNEVSLFDNIPTLQEEPFSKIFNPRSLLSLYLGLHGSRLLSNLPLQYIAKDPEKCVENLGQLLEDMYSFKWRRNIEIALLEFPVDSNFYITETTNILDDGTTTNITDTSNKNMTENLVSGYNEEEYSPSDKTDYDTDSKIDSKGTDKNKRDIVSTKKGFTSNIAKELSSNINYLQNHLLYDIIFKDINYVLTLRIYEQ